MVAQRSIKISSKISTTPLRLVKTKGISRDQWLGARKLGIGSSDAAAAIGLNPYKSQLELWLEKTGRDSNLPLIDPSDETSPAYWGNVLEPIVATHYTKRTGWRVRRVNAILQHPDPDFRWMLANLDREVLGADDVQILECKTAGINGARLWKEGVPEYIQLQVQHQLAVTGKQAADVAVLIGGQHLEVHRVSRDDLLISRLMVLEKNFWMYVESDTPPPADGSESAALALRALYPEDQGTTIDFSDNVNLSSVFSDLQNVRERLDDLNRLESRLKQTLQQAMGAAAYAKFQTGEISWKKSKDSKLLDSARLLSDFPDLLARYSLTRVGSRRFVIS